MARPVEDRKKLKKPMARTGPTAKSESTAAGKHGLLRNRILDAATDLFFTEGYEHVTVDAIVARVGGSKSNIYNHFGGKEGLLYAVVERESAAMRRPLDEIDIEGLPIEQALALVGKTFLSAIYAPRTVALHRLVIAQGGRFPELALIFISGGPGGSTATIARLFKSWQRSGALVASRDPNILARQFLDLVKIDEHSRLLLGLKPAKSVKQLDNVIAEAVRTFLSGVRM